LVPGLALRTDFAVAAVVRAVGAAGAFICQPISMKFKYVVYKLMLAKK